MAIDGELSLASHWLAFKQESGRYLMPAKSMPRFSLCPKCGQDALVLCSVHVYPARGGGERCLSSLCFRSCCYCQAASVVSNSVRPHIRQPTRLCHPQDSPGKNTGVGCHFPLQCIKVKKESEVAQSCLTPGDPMDCSLPGCSVFSRREYWNGLPLPSPWFCRDHPYLPFKFDKSFSYCVH